MATNCWTKRVARRIANRIERGCDTKSKSGASHRFHPKEIYACGSRDRVARLAPYPILPSALLRKGETTAEKYRCDGSSVILHRSQAGVRAYRNQCRHRGSQLVPNKSKPNSMSATIVCPYHAWTYDARTGGLRGVPLERTCFPNLDKESLSLQSVPCFEQAGFIWLGGDKMREKGLWKASEIDLEVATFIESTDHDLLLDHREWTVDANWQLIVETFLEAYHVSSLHKKTLGKVAHSFMVTDVLDSVSYRMCVPLKNFDSKSFFVEEDTNENNDDEFFSQVTTTYFLFPNSAISLFKRFALFLSVEPVPSATDESPSTTTKVQAWGVLRSADCDVQVAKRDFTNVILGIEEDWDCAEGIARGLQTSQEQQFIFGSAELNNLGFQQNVTSSSEILKQSISVP